MIHNTKDPSPALKEIAQPAPESLIHYRVTLAGNDVYRLPASTREIRVLSGGARVWFGDQEYQVLHGDKQPLIPGQNALVMPVSGPESLTLEMGLSASAPEQQQMKRQFYQRMAERQALMDIEDHASVDQR